MITFNLNDYHNSSKEFANHISRFNFLIFNFSKRKNDKIYSFGSELVSFSETSVNRKFLKLITDGNYQYLNQNLTIGPENFLVLKIMFLSSLAIPRISCLIFIILQE